MRAVFKKVSNSSLPCVLAAWTCVVILHWEACTLHMASLPTVDVSTTAEFCGSEDSGAGVYHQFGPVEELYPSCGPTQGWQYVMPPGTETRAVFPVWNRLPSELNTLLPVFRVEGKLQSFFYLGEDLLAC